MQWSTCLPVVSGDVVEDLGDAVPPVDVLVGGDGRLVGVPADVERGGVLAVVERAIKTVVIFFTCLKFTN